MEIENAEKEEYTPANQEWCDAENEKLKLTKIRFMTKEAFAKTTGYAKIRKWYEKKKKGL